MNIQKGFFITGTDTGVGKTQVACAILSCLRQQGKKAIGFKPIASGYESLLRPMNQDALLLQEHSSFPMEYHEVNPYLFNEPAAPHIAAEKNAILLSIGKIQENCQFNRLAEYIIIEGCGGWLVPLNKQETMADLAIALNYPVIIVVGIRLGCLNHALLTFENIKRSRLKIAGWIANIIDPAIDYVEENIQTLVERLTIPLLGVIPYQEPVDIHAMADCLQIAFNRYILGGDFLELTSPLEKA